MAAKPKPNLNIQCDWTELLRHGGEKAWVSCSQKGRPSVYGEISSHGERDEKELRVTEGFEIESFNKRSITIAYPEWKCRTTFLAPSNIFTNIHSKSVCCLDISPGGSLGVSSSDHGDLNVWQTSDGTVRRELKGHLLDVTTCNFFPSGVVLLTGGSDMQLKIWSAENGSCAATLMGHKGGIADTYIIERGRNVLSCSRDGTTRLWDCGTSSCLGVITTCSSPVNACAISSVRDGVDLGRREDESSEIEVGTTGKLLVVAREDKFLQAVGLYSRQKVFQVEGSAAFNTCCFTSEFNIVAGTQDGCLYKYDVRNPSLPLDVVQRNSSPILSIKKVDQGVLVGAGDGCCYLWTEKDQPDVSFTGQDCDAIYKVCANQGHVFTACRDTKIRKYIV